jgi:hypothetical protein
VSDGIAKATMIHFTKHATEAMGKRGIAEEWIEAALTIPDRSEADPRDPGRTRSYKAIAAFGGRILRVVHRPEGANILVITVHFDRGAKT